MRWPMSYLDPMKRLPALTLATLLVVPAPAPAAQPLPDSAGLGMADSAVAAWVAAGRIPGAVLRVSRGGDVILEKAYGWARSFDFLDGEYGLSASGQDSGTALRRVISSTSMTPATVFDLASVTKVMATTFAVMLLVDRGDMELDAPVQRYLPDFRGGGRDGITVRHLELREPSLDDVFAEATGHRLEGAS